MMHLTFDQIGRQIRSYFEDGVESTARAQAFVQRRSKLTGVVFLTAFVFHSLEKKAMTLSSLCASCLDQGVVIKEQGLDQRINDQSVAFMRTLFAQAVQQFRLNVRLGIELLEQFSSVYLVDSTQICLPETLCDLFPGAGGNASAASLKIQLVFDYLRGQLAQVELCSGCTPDQGYHGHWALFGKDVLVMMDLGYFVLDAFKRISAQGGYFLSRFQMQTAVLDPSGQPLDLLTVLMRQNQPVAEVAVCMGSRPQHQIPCRLIIVRLPQEVADRRRQKASKNARNHGRTPDQAYLKLLDWAVFVTNVPEARLHTAHVPALYRIRWQIELVFKLCKSFFGLDYIAAFRAPRILTELYARLIAVVVFHFLIAPIRLPDGRGHNRELSPVKVRTALQHMACNLALTLHNNDAFVAQIRHFFQAVEYFGLKQKRTKAPNALHALECISADYAWHVCLASADDLFNCLPMAA